MIEVKYRCGCMAAEAALLVIPRDPKRDVAEWIDGPLMAAVSYDHKTRSPFCRAVALEYLKIPADDPTGAIGVKPTAQ